MTSTPRRHGFGGGRSAGLVLALLLAFAGRLHAGDLSWVDPLVDRQLTRYPAMNAEDVYKLLYQATRGPGHLGMSYDGALAYLETEAAELDTAASRDTLLVEPIGPHYVRLHLIPYLRRGGNLEHLARAQMISAHTPFDSTAFGRAWKKTLARAKSGAFPSIAEGTFSQLDEIARNHGWPPIHHSDRFRERYTPHYRVLTTEQADSLLCVF